MNSNSKEIIVKDGIVEYREKPKTEVKIKKIENNIETAIKRYRYRDFKKDNNKIAIYKNALNRDEFKRKEIKEVVLDDDQYLQYLEDIITKDYFPDMYKKQYSGGDRNSIIIPNDNNIGNTTVIGGRDLENFDRINREYLEDKEKDLRVISKIDINNISVDSFCMKYSNNELESLKDIIHQDKRRRLEKTFWMYESSHKANEKLKALKAYTNEYIALPDPEKHYQLPEKITAEIDVKNSLFFDPSISNTNNRLNPETYAIKDSEEKIDMDKYSKNIIAKKSIIKENTRFPEHFVNNMMTKHTNNVKRRMIDTYENSDVVKLLRELKEIDSKSKEDNLTLSTPNINGFKLIREQEESINNIPMFTWGEIASTPNILETKKFHIPQTPFRENLAHNLAKKPKDINLLSKPTNKTVRSNTKEYSLTPNAMKLLNSVKRKSTSNIFDRETKTPKINPAQHLTPKSVIIKSINKK